MRPTPVHFDVEIKRLKQADIASARLEDILREHSTQSMPEDPIAVNVLQSLCAEYRRVATTPLEESECASGLRVLLAHIDETVRNLGLFPAEDGFAEGFATTTGCRPSKFSVHVLNRKLYCDSSVLTMPLFAFEVARAFTNANLCWLVSNVPSWASAEGRFCIRALMVEKLVYNPSPTDGGPFVFCGFNDGPFDEAIYSARHLMRAPGCTKGDQSVCALAPVEEGGALIRDAVEYKHMFGSGNRNTPHRKFERYLINRYLDDNEKRDVVVLLRWDASDAFPNERKFVCEKQRRDAQVENVRLDCYKSFREAPPVWYKERRFTKKLQRQLNREEMRQALGGDGGVPKEPVGPNDMFLSESGERKPFRRFVDNEFLHHVHNGIEERTASAKVFRGGFVCFGCQTTYGYVREATKEIDYPCEPCDEICSDDPLAYMPDIDWNERMRKKWFVMDAPMGSGKTEQLSRLVNAVETAGQSVIVVSFAEEQQNDGKRRRTGSGSVNKRIDDGKGHEIDEDDGDSKQEP